jgi:HEAT repeat protein
MIVELAGEPDRDMRALALQQIREEVPGEAATKRFAAMLPKLPPEGQAGLLEALGDRGDTTARPAVLEMLQSQNESVRAAALRALGTLGSSSLVSVLAEKAAADSALESDAARQSLVRLRGEDVNGAIVSTMAAGGPKLRVEMLRVLAARNAKETVPTVLKSAEDAELSVRLAALQALRFLADEKDAAAVVSLVSSAGDEVVRRKAELALLAVCSRGRETCADAIIAGLAGANVESRAALLRALARAGGAEALQATVNHLKDEDEAVRDEAVRMLSAWADATALAHLLRLAEQGKSLRHRVLAVRGLVRLASWPKAQPAHVEVLAKAMDLASRPQEKQLVLGVLGGVGTSESLALVTAAMDDAALVEQAGLAAVMIAEKTRDGNKGQVRVAMKKVLECAKSQEIRQRANKILDSL